MASQNKENWWRNMPLFTQAMDLMIPTVAPLAKDPNAKQQFRQQLEYITEFLLEHPIAKKHSKNKRAIIEHLKYNIDLYNDGKPFNH